MNDNQDKQNHETKSGLLTPKELVNTFRRRTIGGNFVGMTLCMSYFVYFDAVYISKNLDWVVYGSFAFFAFQAAATGLVVRHWLLDLLAYLDFLHEGAPLKPGVREIAQRKVVNLPYLASVVTMGNWLVASLVLPLIVRNVHVIGSDLNFKYRIFIGIIFSGFLTTSLIYFNMEIFSRSIWPRIFPEDKITEVRGALRMKISTRMILSLFVTGVFPITMLSVVVYNKTRIMLEQDPSSLLPSLLAVIFFLLAGSTLATIIVSRMGAKSIVGPLLNLERAIKKVKRGDYQVRVPLVSNDELGTLTENFNQMVGVLRDRERMKVMELELEQGRKIQEDFLPKAIPDVPGWEIDAVFFPARQVSGDFYDVFTLPGGSVAFVIADVCDKGVGSALFMALFRSLLRVYTLQLGNECQDDHDHDTPVQSALYAVSHSNDYIAEVHGEQGMFATVFLGVLNPETGTLDYVNAGHEPPFIACPNGATQMLKPTGPAAGLRSGIKFDHKTLCMGPGDILFGYTDGVMDARNPEGEAFSRERIQFLVGDRPASAHGLIRTMEKSIHSHMAGESQFDDITMIAIRRKT